MSEAPIYEFGDVRLDLGRMAVSRDGRAIDLEPKTFDVLRFLIENRERLVGKDELLDVVWKDTFVTPVRTGETRQLTHITSINGYVRWAAWSPHGDRIVFERNRKAGGVWLAHLP